jgi:hypothetical protein
MRQRGMQPGKQRLRHDLGTVRDELP